MGSPRHDDNLVPVNDICTSRDIARLFGTGASTVSNWKKRYSDFPQPFVRVNGGHTPLYRVSEIIAWYANHFSHREADALRKLADLLDKERSKHASS